MALGTITILAQLQAVGPVFFDVIKVVGDAAYVTGGTVDFEGTVRTRLGDNREVLSVVTNVCGAYWPQYDKENDKLKVLVAATGVEVANAFDLSGTFFQMLVISK